MSDLVSPDVLRAIPQQKQSQAATQDQLASLIAVANRLGFYDAADVLRRMTSGVSR